MTDLPEMSQAEIAAAHVAADIDSLIVAHVNGRDVTRGELNKAFSRVHPLNWKMPIDTVIVINDPAELSLINEAVTFFTGSGCEFNKLTGKGERFHVRAAGYYAMIRA